jgi:hypothetical protein
MGGSGISLLFVASFAVAFKDWFALWRAPPLAG